MDPAGPLDDRLPGTVQQALEHREADGCAVEPVDLRYEPGVRSRPGEPDLTQGDGDRVGDDHTATAARLVRQDGVDVGLAVQLDAGKRRLKRLRQFRVGGAE